VGLGTLEPGPNFSNSFQNHLIREGKGGATMGYKGDFVGGEGSYEKKVQ